MNKFVRLQVLSLRMLLKTKSEWMMKTLHMMTIRTVFQIHQRLISLKARYKIQSPFFHSSKSFSVHLWCIHALETSQITLRTTYFSTVRRKRLKPFKLSAKFSSKISQLTPQKLLALNNLQTEDTSLIFHQDLKR